jgi:hypothetical protein
MPSSGMWRRVGLVRTGVSEERVASIFKVEKIFFNKNVLQVKLKYATTIIFYIVIIISCLV